MYSLQKMNAVESKRQWLRKGARSSQRLIGTCSYQQHSWLNTKNRIHCLKRSTMHQAVSSNVRTREHCKETLELCKKNGTMSKTVNDQSNQHKQHQTKQSNVKRHKTLRK